MYRKQNILLLAMLGAVVLLTIFAYRFLLPDNAVDKELFRVKDLSAIDQVVLKSNSGRIELSLAGARWNANGKPADGDMVQVLMATLAQAEPRRPASKLTGDSTARALMNNGVLVTLSAGNNVVHSFYAGGNLQKTQAYFLKQGETTPYAMVIPGYRVYVSGIFEVNEAGWLDKRIFNFNWRNFTSLKVTFPVSTDEYEVTFDGKIFSLAGIATDTARLNTFLDDVSLLEADRLEFNEPLRDSLARQKPEVSLQVATLSGKVYSLSLFMVPGSNTVYGLMGSNPVAVFDSRKVSPIMRRRHWFALK
ncbi:DUF4340 domain-containing protein [Oscillatoria amoena NRMC-F 0135]|nr:DUF4340 domain-containing protein [Oscillatoria amoena NRMC-F 0135]